MARGFPDYEGGKAGLYPAGFWAAYEGKEVTIRNNAGGKTFAQATTADYTPAVGKTLYITDISFYAFASVVANADNNQFVNFYLAYPDLLTWHVMIGGNGGGYVQLARPLKVDAGETVSARLVARANHAIDVGFTVGGFLVP